jgi:two-component system sensor histidine kinase YesM
MREQVKHRFSSLSLNVKIRLYFAIIAFLFLLVFLVIFTNTTKFNSEYNQIVQSATKASDFSINYKNDFNYKVYRVIIGSLTMEDANLYQDIKEAKELVNILRRTARTKENRDRADDILKYLDNLYRYVDKINENLKETGHYDENITIWESDIQVVNSLIQDTVLEYLYYETLEMEVVRAQMDAQTVKTIEFSVITFAIMFIGAMFFSFKISNSISKPIKNLSSITNQVAQGDLTVRSNLQNGAEVKVLSDSLNIMIEKLSDLIDTVKKEQAHLREAELKCLQEQINPHFLYNTLDTIMWLAESGKQKEVVEMVGLLSQYFRSSLSKGKDRISLREEILHVRSYLQIQQVRYEDIMQFKIDIPEELGDISIPKITLQPIVENALYHGIKNKRGKGTITIEGRGKEDLVTITVSDNGLGMTTERLKTVMDGLLLPVENKDCYGLYNVNERIRLYDGEAYGIKIRSTYLVGTEVEVCIPNHILQMKSKENVISA